MADHADRMRASASAKEAEAARRAGPGQRHEELEARPEVRAEQGYRAALNRRPALAAQSEAGAHLAGRASSGPQPVQRAAAPNRIGLPDRLKSGVEALSGVAMDEVKVHYNSARPTQLDALAYAQGTDIHLAPGQERHLPHEAWHVVQQAQGRVAPTMQRKEGVAINEEAGLEREADIMGSRALAAGAPLPRPDLRDGPEASPAAAQLRRGGLARILIDARGGREPAGSSTNAQVAQLNGKAKQLVSEEMKEFFGADGDFIWVSGETNQSRKMCHVHLFEVSAEKLRGQLTIRSKESDAGGPAFDSANLADDDINAGIFDKYGREEAGRENREAVFSGLRTLMDELFSAWEAWKDKD